MSCSPRRPRTPLAHSRSREGDAGGAVAALRSAWRTWQELEAPYEAARSRVLLGLACAALGDDDTKAVELETARDAFEKLGAALEIARVDELTRPHSAGRRTA